MENVVFKCYSEGDLEKDMLFVNAKDVRKIRTLKHREYLKKLIVDYYDDEFCINTYFICDCVEPIQTI